MNKNIILTHIFLFVGLLCIGQAYPDRHSTSFTDAWTSCEETQSPNTTRDAGHWILYDFGSLYALSESTIWNYNIPNKTSTGLKDIVIDYSNDGTTWTELGTFSLSEGPGSAFYQGDDGPDFEGVIAQYVLINVLSTHGDANCAGMSELKINATITSQTSIPIEELDIELRASPNPASDYTEITIGEYDEELQYSMVDISGRLLRQGVIKTKAMRLNTSTLRSGTYSLSVYNDKGQKTILLNVINN